MGGAERPEFVLARHPELERIWPFVPAALTSGLRALGDLRTVEVAPGTPLHQVTDLADATGVTLFGGHLTAACVAAAPRLRMVGVVSDNAGYNLDFAALTARDIVVIDATRAWAQSVAEIGLCLTLCALRRVPHWHARMAAGEPLFRFEYEQFCDDPNFVDGDLGTKRVGVLGLGQIGRRVAQWAVALGADVAGYDPFLPRELVESWGVRPTDIDGLVEHAQILLVVVPPTPTAQGLLNRERIGRLQRGALVVVITRAAAIDMAALRERILADELMGAFDVYDIEPLPVDDPLRGRPNVVHTPHIGGRTRDANLRVADLIVQDFARLLRGEAPQARLTPEAVAVRTGQAAAPY
jgi:phosphoglycerate dehydrogenase-like enzyme